MPSLSQCIEKLMSYLSEAKKEARISLVHMNK